MIKDILEQTIFNYDFKIAKELFDGLNKKDQNDELAALKRQFYSKEKYNNVVGSVKE